MTIWLFFKKLFLQNTFIGWILLVSLVPIIIITYLVTTVSSTALHHQITNNLSLIADKKISDIEHFFTANKGSAVLLARNLTVVADNPVTSLEQNHLQQNKLVRYLTNFLEQRHYADILILSPVGKVIFSVKQPDLIGKDYSLPPFKTTELGKSFDNAKTLLETALSDFEQTNRGKQVFYIGSPIINENDKLFGVLVLKMNNSAIEKVIMNTEGLGKTGETLVGTMKDGHIMPVAALRNISMGNFIKDQSLFSPALLSAFKDATIGKKGLGEFTDYRDKEVLAVWRYLPTMRWGMLIKIDRNEALKPNINLRKNILTLGAITFILAIILAYAIALRLQRSENQLRRLLSELEIARNDAFDANRAKSAFLANMSHELRTPLNAIIGYSEMLIEEASDEGKTNFVDDLEKIRGAGKDLLELIRDILDISKIEAGRMDVYIENTSLAPLLGDIRNLIIPLMKKKNNHFQLKFSKNIGDIKTDVIKLRQCLLNLLSNASKFTQDGLITLKAKRIRHDDEDWIKFSVSDTGIGMTEEQQKKLFQAFSQVDASTTRKYGGTGLGLYLTQHFARMVGGEINVVSQIDKGSTFILMIPAVAKVSKEDEKAKKAAEITPTPAKTNATVLPTVLVIDDDSRFHQLINESLGHSFHFIHAYNGEEGINIARKLQPDVITLDVMMPGMDGWSVLSILRSDPKVFMIPIIMVTVTGDKELGYTLGVADFLNKPVNVQLLMHKLYQHMSEKSRHILVIEDDTNTRTMLVHTLKKAGLEVSEATNGLEGLESIKTNKPSVILMDLIMPVMDGFELLDRLRHDKIGQDIPVIVLTAKDLTQKDHDLLNGVVTNIIQKSAYQRKELITLIREQINESVESTKNYQLGLIDHPPQKNPAIDVPAATVEATRLNQIQIRIKTYIETIHHYLKYFHENDADQINLKDMEDVKNIDGGLTTLEKKLEELHALIQENKLSDEILSTLRHDLRNAINIIKGYTEMFSENLDAQKQFEIKGYFVIILAAAEQILILIDQIKPLPHND